MTIQQSGKHGSFGDILKSLGSRYESSLRDDATSVMCNIAFYVDNTTLWSDMWSVATTRTGFWTWVCLQKIVDWCMQDKVYWFQCWKNQLILFVVGFNLLNYIGTHCLYCKNCLQENGSLDLFYLFYKSTIRPCMEYCCHQCHTQSQVFFSIPAHDVLGLGP